MSATGPEDTSSQPLVDTAVQDIASAWDLDPPAVTASDGGISTAHGPGNSITLAPGNHFHSRDEIIYEEVGHQLSTAYHDRPNRTFGDEIVNELFGALGRDTRFKDSIQDDIDQLETWYESLDQQPDTDHILGQRDSYLATLDRIEQEIGDTGPDTINQLLQSIGQHQQDLLDSIDGQYLQPLDTPIARHPSFQRYLIDQHVFSFHDQLGVCRNRQDLGKNHPPGETADAISDAQDALEESKEEIRQLNREDIQDYRDQWERQLKQHEFPLQHLIGYSLADDALEAGYDGRQLVRMDNTEIIQEFREEIEQYQHEYAPDLPLDQPRPVDERYH